MHDAMLWFIGGAVLMGMVLAYFIWQDVTLGNDEDAPANVSRRDWDKVSRFERRDR
jgi:hypothetical protein